MKDRLCRWMVLMAICTVAVLFGSLGAVFAYDDPGSDPIDMEAGEVQEGFVPEGTVCESSDPAIAWVDETGTLNALKAGSTTIEVPAVGESEARTVEVNVSKYSDGSEIVGRLKILARYNNSMAFYDGHAYLLFTSYQDGVSIKVDDLYGGYQITDQYYHDIRENIANGSHRTGTDAEKYFVFDDDMKQIDLDRGDIVTIGMYRGFDLTVPQAALGSLKNSSIWAELVKAGKEDAIEAIFNLLEYKKISQEVAMERLIGVLKESGVNYEKWLDGVVEGGVCFNRELYNQKLEWDQYENVTYELDITRNQLEAIEANLGGNLNKFSILKNGCGRVAMRAWNASVGTRDGKPSAYYLSARGKGLSSLVDAPRNVRIAIEDKLPGYYLNNSKGVEEPDAGYQDGDTWVYVSAPENVTPVNYVYESDELILDNEKSRVASLINAARGDTRLVYNKDAQDIGVKLNTAVNDNLTTLTSIEFTVGDKTVTLEGSDLPEAGFWLSQKVPAPTEGEKYTVSDGDGKALASEYADGRVSFKVDALPTSFQVACSGEGARNILRTQTVKPSGSSVAAEVYYKDGGTRVAIGEKAEVASGTTVYIKPDYKSDSSTILTGISLNGEEIMTEENYDAEEGAYKATMPAKFSTLKSTFGGAEVTAKQRDTVQAFVGDELQASDFVSLKIRGEEAAPDQIRWTKLFDMNEVFEMDDSGRVITARKTGSGVIMYKACSAANPNIGKYFLFQVYEDAAQMAKVTFDEESKDFDILMKDGENYSSVPYSGYMVEKGTELKVKPIQTETRVISKIKVNKKKIKVGEKITADKDTEIKVEFLEASVKDMPEEIRLAAKGSTYQLAAKVKYDGLIYGLLSVFDPSLRYVSSSDLLSVSEDGLITVQGDVPEEGAVAYVTAYAGSSNDKVFARSKVILGNYKGADIVGKLTIYARSINKRQLVAHGSICFTTYDDLDLDVSYFHYYEPNEKYRQLMEDYEVHPEKYKSDPALCSGNELGIEDRASYFNEKVAGVKSQPQKVSLKTGESITMANYAYKEPLALLLDALENGLLGYDEDTQKLIAQIKKHMNGEEVDGEEAFEGMLQTLIKAYAFCFALDYNPLNGVSSDGGLDVNREIYNQFVRDADLQTPNNYYEVEITRDELAELQSYLEDPSNNYYSLFTKNCTTGIVDIWNAVLKDRPELQLKANYTRFARDPQSLNIELGLLALNKDLPGKGGKNFYPRTVASRHLWAVTAEANTLSARCANTKSLHYLGHCQYLNEGAALTVTATGCSLDAVTVQGLEEFNELTGKSVAVTDEYVKFFRTDKAGAVSGGTEVPSGTTEDGFYYVQLTVGDQSARYAFQQGKPGSAEAVKKQIDALPPVDKVATSDKAAIQAARNAYDALSADQKALIDQATLKKLTDDEAALKAAEEQQNKQLAARKKTAQAAMDQGLVIKQKGNALQVKWVGTKVADGYDVYAGYGKSASRAATVRKATSASVTRINGAAIDTKKVFRVYVAAYKMVDGRKVTLAKTMDAYVAGQKNAKYTNAKKIKIKKKKTKIKVKVGKSKKAKAKVKKEKKGKKLLPKNYAPKLRYKSSDTSIATVSSKGKVKGVRKGTCKVYVTAANGLTKVINVTVK